MSRFDHPARVSRLQGELADADVDLAFFSVGADLPYLTGYEAMESERLTVLVVARTGVPTLLVPRLEAPRVGPGEFELLTWGETDDPLDLAASLGGHPRRVAVGDHMWSRFLLGFQQRWPHVTWSAASEITRGLRMRKDDQEVDALRRAAQAADRVMQRIPAEIVFSGHTELDVARRIREMLVEEGHEVAEFAIVGSGPNSASPHHEPTDRVIETGDLVVCDFGGRLDGYYSDTTRTFVVGKPTAFQTEVHRLVEIANRAGRDAVAPGVPCFEVDAAARHVIEVEGHGEHFIHRTGHGIGLEVHEHPYMVAGNDETLAPGMSFSIEPGVYLPGQLGVRVEDIVVCTEQGGQSLNESDRSLVQVD